MHFSELEFSRTSISVVYLQQDNSFQGKISFSVSIKRMTDLWDSLQKCSCVVEGNRTRYVPCSSTATKPKAVPHFQVRWKENFESIIIKLNSDAGNIMRTCVFRYYVRRTIDKRKAFRMRSLSEGI